MASTKKTAQSTLILNNNVDGGDQEIEGSIGGFGPEDIVALYSAKHGRNYSLTWGTIPPPPPIFFILILLVYIGTNFSNFIL